jgi:hypothetical protein
MIVKVYRRKNSGLGSPPRRFDKSKIRVRKCYWDDTRNEEVEVVLNYQEYIDDLVRQGVMIEEAIDMLGDCLSFDTEEAFYAIELRLDRDAVKDLFFELIKEHLDRCDSSATPNVCEMAALGQAGNLLALAVFDIVFRERVSIGTAIIALEGQLA